MTWRSRSFLKQKGTLQRPSVTFDVTNIRDRKLTGYTTVKTNVPCWAEPIGSDVIPDSKLGRQVVDRYDIWFKGSEDVQANDRLLIGTTYYLIEGVLKYGTFDWQIKASAMKLNRVQS